MQAPSTENNIPFPCFHLRGKWPINSYEIKCWQAKHDKNVTLELPFSFFFFSLAKVMQCTEYSKIWPNITFAIVSLTFSRGHKALPVFHADRVIIG